jgi:hypothetical protein
LKRKHSEHERANSHAPAHIKKRPKSIKEIDRDKPFERHLETTRALQAEPAELGALVHFYDGLISFTAWLAFVDDTHHKPQQ